MAEARARRHGQSLRATGRIAVLLAAVAGASATAAELRGRVELLSGGQPLRASEAVEAVVYFRPAQRPTLAAPTEGAVLTTRRKQFLPRVLPIVAGSTVQFPNEDVILHNAFSSSPGNQFDTGAYGSGEGSRHTFATPGLVKVYCNVHQAMFAHILVLDTPWFTRPDAQGRFVLADLPDEAGELVVFHERANPWQQRLLPTEAGDVAVRLELTRRKVPPHMNKFGKPYQRTPSDAGNY
jgi:plastocyanin